MTKRESIAWAAGLFEGEGCFHLRTNARGYKGTKARCSASMSMTDFDVISRFAEIVGGSLLGPYESYYKTKSGIAAKPFWFWSVTGIEDVRSILLTFWPWLGKRRRAKGLEVLAKNPPSTIRKRRRTPPVQFTRVDFDSDALLALHTIENGGLFEAMN